MNLQTFLEFTFTSFWHFVGVFMLVTIPFNFTFRVIKVIAERNKPHENRDEDVEDDDLILS